MILTGVDQRFNKIGLTYRDQLGLFGWNYNEANGALIEARMKISPSSAVGAAERLALARFLALLKSQMVVI